MANVNSSDAAASEALQHRQSNFISERVRKTKQQPQTANKKSPLLLQTRSGKTSSSPDGRKSPPDQIPQVYYSRKLSRRDGGGQDVTGSGIDWLRQKIGESGRINMLGAWTESRETRGREDCDYCFSLAFSLLGSSKLCLIKTEYRPLRMGGKNVV